MNPARATQEPADPSDGDGAGSDGVIHLLDRARRLAGEWLLLAPFAGRARLGWQPFAWLEQKPGECPRLYHEGRGSLLPGAALELVGRLCDRFGSPAAGYVGHDYGAWRQGQPLPSPCESPLLRFAWYSRWEERPISTAVSAPFSPSGLQRLRPLWPRERWLAAVEEIRSRIRRGDVYQVNLVQPFEADVSCDGTDLWASLLAHGRPPYSACLRLPDRWLLSLSPEQFLSRRGATLQTAPIKGTAPAGEEGALALLASAKDRAELAMIVDLLRNDLSRVCEPGSVITGPFPELLHLPTLVHTFTRVEGHLQPGRGLQEAFDALFPCGSITGCPRLNALDCLRELEGEGRGLAMGAVGIVEPGGDFDFSVAIRSGWLRQGRLHVRAGGGITWQSTPEAEWEESLRKVLAFEAGLAEATGLPGTETDFASG